ncbi:MAG: dipeptide epimerase [Chthonomonadales bacterium]|nr:dipeptide epimerase [Chthonomonadales bacterium]
MFDSGGLQAVPRIERVSATPCEIPLRRAFATARDALARQVTLPVLIRIDCDDGLTALGEAVAVGYVTGESQASMVADVERAAARMLGGDVLRTRALTDALAEALPESPSARAGIEIALWNAHADALGVSLWRLWGGAADRVQTDVTLSLADDPAAAAREAARQGFASFKVKVSGGAPDDDFRRLVAVAEAVPGAALRVDANQGFDAAGALAFAARLAKAGLPVEAFEQPVAADDLAALDAVAASSPIPVFADEAVKTPADALRVVRETRAHGINVKLMKSGVSGAFDIVAIARAAGRRLMIGCMLETRRGIAASLAFAAGTGAFELADLDSHLLLREEGPNPHFLQDGPEMRVLG